MINWHSPTPPAVPFITSTFNYSLSDNLKSYEECGILKLELMKTMLSYLGFESM